MTFWGNVFHAGKISTADVLYCYSYVYMCEYKSLLYPLFMSSPACNIYYTLFQFIVSLTVRLFYSISILTLLSLMIHTHMRLTIVRICRTASSISHSLWKTKIYIYIDIYVRSPENFDKLYLRYKQDLKNLRFTQRD